MFSIKNRRSSTLSLLAQEVFGFIPNLQESHTWIQPKPRDVLGLYAGVSEVWSLVDSINIVFQYEDIASMLKEWKYGSREYLPEAILETFADSIQKIRPPYMIAYVPIGVDRWFKRGFNQAKKLAEYASARTWMPVTHSLFRLLSGFHQAKLTKKSREARSSRIFTPPFTRIHVPVVLVDDVISTWATAAACAQALRMRGCPSVHLLVLSRTSGSRLTWG